MGRVTAGWTLASTLAIVSCSGAPGTGAIGATSGTRLRAWVDDAGGGARRFVDWRDTQLGIDCSFRRTADGTLRCLDDAWATIAYTDAACTDAVVLRYMPDDGGTHYVSSYDVTPITCAAPGGLGALGGLAGGAPALVTAVHLVGAPRAQPDMLFAPAAGACTAWGTAGLAPRAASYASLADEVSFDRFAAGTLVESPRAGGITLREIVSDDARQLMDFVRSDTHAPCRASLMADGPRCIPPLVASEHTGVFGNATCTQPTASATTVSAMCPQPTLLLRPSSSCGPEELRPLGDFTNSGFTLHGTDCVPTMLGSVGPAWYAGDPLTGAALDAAAPALRFGAIGSGRLRVATTTDLDGALLATGGLWEAPDGTACQTVGLPDHHVICGRFAFAGVLFSDAACTVSVATSTSSSCDPAMPTAAYTTGSGELHALAGPHTGATYQNVPGVGCVGSGSLGASALYVLGDVLPASTFPSIERVLD